MSAVANLAMIFRSLQPVVPGKLVLTQGCLEFDSGRPSFVIGLRAGHTKFW